MPDIERVLQKLDQYVNRRMQAACTPGMVIALTDREGLLQVSAYGVTDLEAEMPVTLDTLFEIGSISKTFTSVAVLQAHEAGLLDLHAPVTEYLPWFRVRSEYGPIAIHHLLSHSAGLVYSLDFSPDPRGAVLAARELDVGFAPGDHFWYSEVGYQTLTLVLEAVRGHSIGHTIGAGILEPLEMNATVSAITHDVRPRLARGYRFLYDDRPSHVSHPLVPAPWLEFNSGDGCVASTGEDMARFARMLLNRGQGPQGPVLTEDSYRLMIQPVVKGAEYGYGLLAFEEGGFRCIGHAGEMPGYEAYLWMDLDNGLGMVLLATQPYPSGLSRSVLQILRAASLGKPLPNLRLTDPTSIENAGDYAGTYHGIDHSEGRVLSFVARGERLFLEEGGEEFTLEQRGTDRFYVNHPDFDRHVLGFLRTGEEERAQVVEACHGADWYVNDAYSGPCSFRYPREWDAYAGHYRAHNPWESNFRMIIRKGKPLLVRPAGDEEPLTPLGNAEFRVGRDAFSPERLRFDQVVEGQALRARLSGFGFHRFFTP